MFKFFNSWWNESRVVRKFRRDTAAMLSLLVIGVYAGVFIWTMITPLDVNYVNLQQRKINEHKEHTQTVKDLTFKGQQLRKQISLLSAKPSAAKKASPTKAKQGKAKQGKAAPRKAAKAKKAPPTPRKVAGKPAVGVVARKPAPRKAVAKKPAPPKAPAARAAAPAARDAAPAARAAAPAAHSHGNYAARAHTHGNYAAKAHKHDGYAAKDHTHKSAALASHRHGEFAALAHLRADIGRLQKALALQQQLGAMERERMMAQVKLLRKPPEELGWLSRYNQDLGFAYAKPAWWGANERERTIVSLIIPQMPLAAKWVRQEIMGHSRRGLLGSDRLGRDIFKRVLVSVNVAFKIGFVTALIACFIGLLLGGIAGFFGGWVDLFITYIYSVFSAVPYIVLVLLIAAIFRDSPGLLGLYVAFGATFWIGPARVVRGEVLKIKQMEYVQAAWALGNSRMRILIRHVLPNTMHLIFVYFSLIFIGAIKSEVILTFLGLGVKNMPSWGGMISDASKEIIGGFWWQMIGASVALFFLVYAFNIFTDALQDALDPKHTK